MKKIKGLEEDLESAYKSIDIFTNKYKDNLEKINKMEEDLENAYKTIDILTKNKYDPNKFDIYDNHKDLVINMILTVLIETAITKMV